MYPKMIKYDFKIKKLNGYYSVKVYRNNKLYGEDHFKTMTEINKEISQFKKYHRDLEKRYARNVKFTVLK